MSCFCHDWPPWSCIMWVLDPRAQAPLLTPLGQQSPQMHLAQPLDLSQNPNSSFSPLESTCSRLANVWPGGQEKFKRETMDQSRWDSAFPSENRDNFEVVGKSSSPGLCNHQIVAISWLFKSDSRQNRVGSLASCPENVVEENFSCSAFETFFNLTGCPEDLRKNRSLPTGYMCAAENSAWRAWVSGRKGHTEFPVQAIFSPAWSLTWTYLTDQRIPFHFLSVAEVTLNSR